MLNTAKLQRLARLRSAAAIPVATRRQLLSQSLPGEWDMLEPQLQSRLLASESALLGLLIRRLLDFSGSTDDLVVALTHRLLALACPSGGWLWTADQDAADGAAADLPHTPNGLDTWGSVAAVAALSRVLDEPALPRDLASEAQHVLTAALDRLIQAEAAADALPDADMLAWRLRLLSEADEPADRLRLRKQVEAWCPVAPTGDFTRLALAHARAQLRPTHQPQSAPVLAA